MRSTFLFSTVLASLVLASSAPALAADEEPAEGSEEQPKPKKKAKPAESAPAPAAQAGERNDHDQVVGKIGVGYLGAMPTPLGAGTGSGNVTAQIIGARYWLNPGMGITAGLGFGTASSSFSQNGTNTDGPSATVFALKGGLPLSMATSKHYTFVLETQLAFSYASSSYTQGDTTLDRSGYRVAVGATAGAEIQFGFIGIPELSLVGSVGLAFDTQGGKGTLKQGSNAPVETATSQTSLATFTRENPWNIFAGNVAAIYYF